MTRRRSVHRKAVRLLCAAELNDACEQARAEWSATEEAGLWKVAAGDGINGEALRLHLSL